MDHLLDFKVEHADVNYHPDGLSYPNRQHDVPQLHPFTTFAPTRTHARFLA
jgi:hypothetical protein